MAPAPGNGDGMSDGGLCASCRDDFQSVEIVGMRLSTTSLHHFHFSWPSCELGEERSLAGWDDGDLKGL